MVGRRSLHHFKSNPVKTYDEKGPSLGQPGEKAGQTGEASGQAKSEVAKEKQVVESSVGHPGPNVGQDASDSGARTIPTESQWKSPDLLLMASRWDSLPPAIKRAVVALVEGNASIVSLRQACVGRRILRNLGQR